MQSEEDLYGNSVPIQVIEETGEDMVEDSPMQDLSIAPLSLNDLKSKFKTARETIDQLRKVPIEQLEHFVRYLEWVKTNGIEETIYSQPDLKKFFFEEFVGGLAKRLSLTKDLEASFQPLVHQLVMMLVDIYQVEVSRDNGDMADGMRYLFDAQAPLHQYLFQEQDNSDKENISEVVDGEIGDKLPEEERAWRKALKVGDLVDALKKDFEYNLKIWAKAKVTNIRENDLIEVTFINDYTKTSRNIWWYSPELAAYESKSGGDEWRGDLKVGDLVDAYDSTRIWYASTISDRTYRRDLDDPDSKQLIMLKVGFRTYHPEGNKEDDQKKKFFGWSESFDEWIPAYSPRIQKLNTFAKSFEDSQSQLGNILEETIDDQMDMLLYAKNPGQKVFAITRKKCKSFLLVQIINRLGEGGFFERILERVAASESPIDVAFYYVDSMQKCLQMFNRGFINEYFPALYKAVKAKILNSGEAQLRNVKKDRIDAIIQGLINGLMPRLMTYRQRDQEKNQMMLQIGCHFLTFNFLEKRIDGAKMIQEVSKAQNLASYNSSSETMQNNAVKQLQMQFLADVINTIREKKVLWQTFSKERGHMQLVQRADELIKLLMLQGNLTKEELDLIWSAIKIDENTQLEIYKLFNELASRLKLDVIHYVLDQLSCVPLTKVQSVELQLVYEIGKRAISGECTYGEKVLEYMWKLAIPNENIDKVLIITAASALTDVLKTWENTYKLEWADRIIQALKQNRDGYLCIKMLSGIFREFIGVPTVATEPKKEGEQPMEIDQSNTPQIRDKFENRSTFIEYINYELGLMDTFFSNFHDYMLRARTGLRQKIATEPQTDVKTFSEKVLADRFFHSDQMLERFEFIKQVSHNSSVKVNKDQLAILWNEMVAVAMFPSDSDQFFRLLREICDMHSHGFSIVELSDLIEFFNEQIFSSEEEIITRITPDGFAAIQSFLLLMNASTLKLERLYLQSSLLASNGDAGTTGSYPPQKFTSFSNTGVAQYQTYSFTDNKNNDSGNNQEEAEFHIHVPPWEIIGVDNVWQIFVETKDQKVLDKTCVFLIKLYTNVTFALEERLSEFEDAFLEKCFNGIQEMQERITARREPAKEVFEQVQKPMTAFSSLTSTVMQRVLPFEEKRIIKYISLIQELIRHSEKEGTRGVKSHAALFKGAFLDCLQVSNSIKTGQKFQTKHEIGVQSNISLWDLRKVIGQHCARVYKENGEYVQEKPCHPASVRIFRSVGCADLKEIENGKTLSELRFKRNEVLTAYRRSLYSTLVIPLQNFNKTDLSERAKHVFTQWFNQCSDVINPKDPQSARGMDHVNCQNFIISATDEPVSLTDASLLSMFEAYDYNNDGYIELEGFLNFWKDSINNRENIVRANLLTYGYRYDLRRQPGDGMEDDYLQVRKSQEDMPRFKVARKPEYFDLLFDIMDTTDNDVAQVAWSLVKSASTNPDLYRKVLELNMDPSFKWADIFDAQNIHKMLYVLQIVESLLEESSTQEDGMTKDWVQRFMLLGGFQQILAMFHESLGVLSHKHADNLGKFEKSFLEYMLKLIKIFILAAFSVDEVGGGDLTADSVFDVIQMVKTASSQNEPLPDPSEQQQQEQPEQTTDEENKFKTPSKAKGKFVKSRQIDKKVTFDTVEPEITQELLFGQDEAGVQTEENPNASSKNFESANANNSPDDTKKRFADLAKIMRQSGLGGEILQKIDFKELQVEVLEVICILLGKREIGPDDCSIIENALGLWAATLIKNGNLINDFYEFKREGAGSTFMPIKTAEDFIAQGVHTYKSQKIREEFAASILCLAQKVNNAEGQNPILYFINVLRRNYPTEDTYYISRECKQYFDLMVALIQEYIGSIFKREGTDIELTRVLALSQVDLFDILKEAIDRLKVHASKETKNCILEDKTQIGYFNFIERLLTILKPYDAKRANEVIEETFLLDELFYGHLFYKPGHSLNECKSKTKESRAAAYSLLQRTIEATQPHTLAEFLEDRLWPLIKDVDRPKKWKYVAADGQRGSSAQHVGLVNLGCICYMNSMLQQFFMVPQFRYQLLKAIDGSAADLKEYKGYIIDDSLLRQLQIMFANLELSERQAFYPLGFCFAFKDLEGNPTNTALQQDAQEFINFFFGRLEDLLKPTSQKHLLESVFGGKVCSQLICPSCGNCRNILESYYNLSVQVKDRKSLDESLRKMIESSIINDFKCDNCNQKVDVEKRQLIAEPPNVLIVNLQRIIFNFDTFQNDKINSHFEFPNILNLRDYSFKQVMTAEGQAEKVMQEEGVKHLMDIEDDDYLYKLVGVTIHRGTAEHGHYYSLINTKRGKSEDDETKPDWQRTDKDPWKVFDDETVKPFTFSELQSEAFGGSSSSSGSTFDADLSAYLFQTGTANSYGQNAYMLVYEKMKKKPIKEVVLEEAKDEDTEMTNEGETAALGCADTAISRAANADGSQSAAPAEITRLIPYREVEPYVPEWIKSQILEDNNQFLIDRYIFHESFFNLVKGILRHVANGVVTTSHQYSLDYLPWFHKVKSCSLKIASKVCFDMLAYFNLNTQISDITTSLQTIFTFSDSYFYLKRGDPSLLLEFMVTTYLQDGCKHFLSIMFDCPDKTSRFYCGKLTAILLNKVFAIHQEAIDKQLEPCQGLIDLREAADALLLKFVKTLKTPECMKNWSKLEQYLRMIHDVATGGPYQSDLLLSTFEIVAWLLDFVLANCNAKTSAKLSTFEHIVALICYFVRFSLTPSMRAEKHLWAGENQTKKPPSTLNGFDDQALIASDEKYPMHDSHFDYLIESDLVSMALKEGVQTESLGKMVAHLAYRHKKFSKKVCKILLHGISRNDYEKIKSYLDVVTQLALIKDEHQQSRLEWMFGYGAIYSHTSLTAITNDPNEVLTKVGVKVLHSLNDEAFTFKSALIQDSVDDALLHLLWRYKGRMDTYTVNCLYSLLCLITVDTDVALYFASLPGPTYCLARYTDWFRPYLNKQLADAKKGFAGALSGQREEIVVKCLSMLDQYELFMKEKGLTLENSAEQTALIQAKEDIQMASAVVEYQNLIDIDGTGFGGENGEENIRNLIIANSNSEQSVVANCPAEPVINSEVVIRSNPQPYVIVDCVGERVISEHDFGNVVLQVSALGCFYTESLPTGESNIAIPQGVFKRAAKQGGNRLLNHVGSARVKNAEEEMQAQYINNYFQSAGMTAKTNGVSGGGSGSTIDEAPKPGNTTPKKSYEAQGYHEEEEAMQQEDDPVKVPLGGQRVIIKDDDSEWQKINKNTDCNDIDQETNTEAFDGQQNSYKPLDDGQGNTQEPAYKIKVVELGADEEGNIDQTGHADEETEQVSWPFQVNYCEDLCYKYQVINYRDATIKCSLNITPEDNAKDISLSYPRGGFKAVIQPKTTKTMIVLHKTHVQEDQQFGAEINKFQTHFQFKEAFADATADKSNQSKNVQVRSVPPLRIVPDNTSLQNAPMDFGVILPAQREDANSDANSNNANIDDHEDQANLFNPDEITTIEGINQAAGNNNDGGASAVVYPFDGDEAYGLENDDADKKPCDVCTYLNELTARRCEMCDSAF